MEVTLQPAVLRWARERAGFSRPALSEVMRVEPQEVETWETDGTIPFARAEELASKTHTPFGYLFLTSPPEEPLPIHDFRTLDDNQPHRPSPNLLDTIYIMQRRQAWMRDFLAEEGAVPLPFVGSATLDDDPVAVASAIRLTFGLEDTWASKLSTWEAALRFLREKVEASGILIVINGVVGNNTRRKLDVEEFRGFVLVDEYAPFIFLNGADAIVGKMFTLAHELAHIWLGVTGISNPDPAKTQGGQHHSHSIERFCNEVAAEFLVPGAKLTAYWELAQHYDAPFDYLAQVFKVSQIVVARRALDAKLIDRNIFFEFYNKYSAEQYPVPKKGGGGDFWSVQKVRIGERFGRAVIQAVREGKLLYQEAYRLTGLRDTSFEQFARRIG